MAFNFSIAPRSNYELPSQIMRQSLESDLALRQAQEAERRLRQVDEDWRIQQVGKSAYGQTLNEAGAVADVRPMVQATKEQNLGPGPLQGLFSQESTQQKQLTEGAESGLLAKLLGVNREKAMPSTGTPQSIGFQQAQAPSATAAIDTSAEAKNISRQVVQGEGYADRVSDLVRRGLLRGDETPEQISDAIYRDVLRNLETVGRPVLGIPERGKVAETLSRFMGAAEASRAERAKLGVEYLGRGTMEKELATRGTIEGQERAATADRRAAQEFNRPIIAANQLLKAYNESGDRIIDENGKPIIIDPQKVKSPEEAQQIVETAFAKQKSGQIIDNLHAGMTPDQIETWKHAATTNIGRLEGVTGTISGTEAFDRLAVPNDLKQALYRAHESRAGITSALIGYATRAIVGGADIEEVKRNLHTSLNSLTTVDSKLRAVRLPEGQTLQYIETVGVSRRETGNKALARALAKRGKAGVEPGSSAKVPISVSSREELQAVAPGSWVKLPDGTITQRKRGK